MFIIQPSLQFTAVLKLSGHNLAQAWGFCMDFLNHRKGGMVFYQVFLLYSVQLPKSRNCKRLREFEEIEISRPSCGGDCETMNSKDEKSWNLFLDFVREFGLWRRAELLLPPTQVRFDVSTQYQRGGGPPLFSILLLCGVTTGTCLCVRILVM